MPTSPPLREALQSGLRTAMKARDGVATRAVRSAMSAIANAEAITPPSSSPAEDGPIAGAISGVGAAEVARRDLTDAELRAIVEAEIHERTTASAEYERLGATDRAAVLRAEAAVLRRLLDRPS